MQKLSLRFVTWQRPDANGLFDYQSVLQAYNQIFIENNGYIYRNVHDYNLIFVKAEQKDKFDVNNTFDRILKIIKRNSHYLLEHVNIANEPLCKIVCNGPSSHKIKVSNVIRLGKIQVQVAQLKFKIKKFKSHYQQLKNEILPNPISNLTQITPSFYTHPQQSPSLLTQNPCCRYCYSKTPTPSNPFVICCQCKGYMKYVHQECLVEWVGKRGNLQFIKQGICSVGQDVIRCEICKTFYHHYTIFNKLYSYQKNLLKEQFIGQSINHTKQSFDQDFVILHFKQPICQFYLIQLGKDKQISIGRSIQCDIVLNQLSVSRKHAFIEINNQSKSLILKDNSSKFGTLVELKITQIQNHETYQVGRSKLNFQLIKKKSFIDKIGMCFNKQVLRNQRNKFQRTQLR